ncbi:MAG TPA: DUF6438 domain-containing protein [Pyrinomonadaceae bacterium]|jgi:hypothetical protein
MMQTIVALSLYFSLAFGGAVNGLIGCRSLPTQQTTIVQDVPADTVITIERTACFGPCPMYKLAIYADGRVVYEGKNNVKQTGKVESSITQDKIRELVAAFEQIEYFKLKDRYSGQDCPQMWTDHPSAITSLTMNGKSKTVKHYYGCQGLEILDRLTKLESKIDEAANVNQWIK